MAAAIGGFQTVGPAEYRRARSAALVDFASALILAMLAFPFPFARAVLAVPVFVASILATIVVFHVVYLTAVLVIWGRTPGMYLLDLGLDGGRTSVREGLGWGLGAALAFWPTVASSSLGDPESGLPSRLSGRPTLATASDREGEDVS